MKTMGIGAFEAKTRFSELLRHVEAGGVVRVSRRNRHVADLAGLPIESEGPPDAFIRERIRELARDYRLTAYEAAYLECAQRNGRRLMTLDRGLLGLRDRFEFIS